MRSFAISGSGLDGTTAVFYARCHVALGETMAKALAQVFAVMISVQVVSLLCLD